MAYCTGNDCYAQVNENIQFTDSSTGGTFTGWTWNFGDGGTSTLQNPIHPYSSIGNYPVSHSSTDGCGTGTCTSKTVHVSATPPPPPPTTIPFEFLALAGIGALGLIYLSQSQPQSKYK